MTIDMWGVGGALRIRKHGHTYHNWPDLLSIELWSLEVWPHLARSSEGPCGPIDGLGGQTCGPSEGPSESPWWPDLDCSLVSPLCCVCHGNLRIRSPFVQSAPRPPRARPGCKNLSVLLRMHRFLVLGLGSWRARQPFA